MFRHVGARQVCPQLLRASPAPASSATTALLASQAARLGQRSAADRASRVRTFASPRAPRPPPRAPAQQSSLPDKYTLDDITVQRFDDAIKSAGSFKALSAAGYYEVAQRFVDAIQKGSHPWSVRLAGENPVPAVVLYDVGCIMRHMGPSRNLMVVSIAMWASASEMGSRLATISIAKELIRTGAWGSSNKFTKLEGRFRQLVAEGKEPNALTVQGELLFGLSNYAEAVRTLKKALGPDNSSEFEWKTDCQLSLAKSYIKLQNTAEAKAILEEISASGSADASAELGQLLLSDNSDKAEQLLFAAGIKGKLASFSQLSEISLEKQSKATTAEDKKEHNLWAKEFARLADPRAPF